MEWIYRNFLGYEITYASFCFIKLRQVDNPLHACFLMKTWLTSNQVKLTTFTQWIMKKLRCFDVLIFLDREAALDLIEWSSP